MKKIWELKQAAEPGVLELYIYGDVEGDHYDYWENTKIESGTSADHFREELGKHPNATEIHLYINSYGGSVFEGTAIYNQLRRHPAKKVVHIDGFACSVASLIAMAGDEVIMPKNAMMMIHHAWMLACGNADELRKSAEDLDIINKGNRQAYLQKAGGKLDEETLIRMMDEETWLTAEDCIRLGLADRYADKDADMADASAILKKAELNVKQRINLQKTLAAQLREMVKPKQEPKLEPMPPKPKEPPDNLMQMLRGIFEM